MVAELEGAAQRIERARREGSTNLDLSFLNLETLPDSLRYLSELTTLNLKGTQLRALPVWLGNLTQLTGLYLGGTRLTVLPDWLRTFTQLTTLDLSRTQLTELPDWLGNFTQLTGLDVSGNQLTELPDWLGNLTQLTGLDVSGNWLKKLPESLSNLSQLTTLNLKGTQLRALPVWLGNLTQLTGLYLGGTRLTVLPSWLRTFTQLTTLDLSRTEITVLPGWLGNLTQLTMLDVSYCRLTELPDSMGDLTQLAELYLTGTWLTTLPDWLANLTQLTKLNLNYTRLTSPPPEVVRAGSGAVLAFLRDRASGVERVWRSKLLVVGEATVGKTTLAKQLTGGVYDPDEAQTHGVHIDTLELPHPTELDATMQLAVWDFGGQLEYRATQRFYLTDRSLFVLVWNARARWQDGKLLAWLDTITARAPESPILVVATHRDDASAATLPEDLRDRYPRIVALHEVDAKSGHGIDEIRDVVREHAAGLPLMGASWPRSWIKASERIGRLEGHAAPATALWDTMSETGVNDPQAQRALARAMHDLGDIVFFADDPGLNDKAILRPAWLDECITRILDSGPVAMTRGVLSRAERARQWHDVDPDLYDRLLRMMERFDLAYRVGDSETSQDVALIVERLGYAQPPEVAVRWQEALDEPGVREIGFDFTLRSRQAGIPTWFIARQHHYTTGLHWTHGVLLHDRNPQQRAYALVRDDGAERPTVSIRVRSHHPAPMLSVLAEAFRNIVEPRYPGLITTTSVPCLCRHPPEPLCGHSFTLAELMAEIEDPDPEAGKVRCPSTRRRIEARTMLDGLRGSGVDQRLDRLEHAHTSTLQFAEQQRVDTLNAIRTLNARRAASGEHCPSLFAIEDLGRVGVLRRRIYRISLWCEWPDQPHALNPNHDHDLGPAHGVYNVSQLPDGLRDYLPFLRALITTLGILTPVLTPTVEAAGIPLSERTKEASEALSKTLDALGRLPGPRNDTDFWAPGARHGAWRRAEIPADFRILRNALTELDPLQLWGGLSPATRPEDNTVIYLCDTHLREFDHPYQHTTI